MSVFRTLLWVANLVFCFTAGKQGNCGSVDSQNLESLALSEPQQLGFDLIIVLSSYLGLTLVIGFIANRKGPGKPPGEYFVGGEMRGGHAAFLYRADNPVLEGF